MSPVTGADLTTEIAHAKINLALHVRERRPDGYHRIETLFAFCEDGDRVALTSGSNGDTLAVTGPFADGLAAGPENLVLAAVRLMRRFEAPGSPPFAPAALHLEKVLPVAAGLGGGSADAGATLRLLNRHWEAGADLVQLCGLAAELGADVPACLVSRTCVGMGTGAELASAQGEDVARLPVLLVNPGAPLATRAVFRAWGGTDGGPLRDGNALEAALAGRNDLEAPAIALCPVVADVLDVLRGTRPLLARMSGSGATCFALFADDDARDAADAAVAALAPRWWRLRTRLR